MTRVLDAACELGYEKKLEQEARLTAHRIMTCQNYISVLPDALKVVHKLRTIHLIIAFRRPEDLYTSRLTLDTFVKVYILQQPSTSHQSAASSHSELDHSDLPG